MLENIPFIGLLILAANVIISLIGFKQEHFFDKYRFEIKKINQGEYFRLLTSAFLHVNTTHLLFNMITFYFFVSFVVYSLGSIPFVLLYFGSLIAGNGFAFAFHSKQPNYIAVGASGAVTGVLFSALLLYPELEMMLFFIPIPIPGYLFGIGYMIYTLYGMKVQNDNIGHTAHFGGAIGGILMTILFNFEVIYTSLLMLGILSVTLILAGVLLYRNQK
ncbi:rhomboid family intramembrane serine protease [Flavobacteriaceae bacterium]|jgi:membrane associated rhomboid family serine protease|nr:rhomboid family intramembrane serine protease [Flavobacteriaceae bacterium]MDC0386030.1 rhomboid family intramembrane serine protease [Flavobacteriaceae bacterium]MDC0872902.1 rhomboid family intramembrane serine protease [Flavobacteriaceae bacterium]MDC3241126.1 rhomboid family intramembrane serine protease [Flavobacteriaceae bacterium]